MLKEKLEKAAKKARNIVKRTPAASAMMALAMGATALTSCSWERHRDSTGYWSEDQSLDIQSIFAGSRKGAIGINDGYRCYSRHPRYRGIPMGIREARHSPDVRIRPSGGVSYRDVHYSLSADEGNLVPAKDVKGNEWQVPKEAKKYLPKGGFMVVEAEGHTIPVPAKEYEQVTNALKKGELTFVVDANGHYGLVTTEAAKEIQSGNLTLEQLANLSNAKTAPNVAKDNKTR